MSTADQNTKHVTRPQPVTRLKLAAATAAAVLLTATCHPPAPALAAVERRAIEAYEALQVVYAVVRADAAPAG